MRGWRPVAAAALLLAACGEERAELSVEPVRALADAPMTLRATGLEAREAVELRARAVDARDRVWRARARVRADGRGRVRYDGNRLLTALDAGEGSDGLFEPGPEMEVALSLRRDGGSGPRATAVREWMRAKSRSLERHRFTGVLYGERLRGAPVLLLGGSEGGISMRDVAMLLAARGHPALAIAYFGEEGQPQRLERVPVEPVWRAAEHLIDETGRKPVVLGVSRGAELALLAASMSPDAFAGVVAYAPSSVVNPAPDARSPAWTAGGRPVPFVRRALGDPAPAGSEARAIIRVERIRGPVMLVTGGDDGLIPASAYGLAITHRRDGRTTELDFPDAGHAITAVVPNLPVDPPAEFGGTREADARARQEAWTEVLELLGRLPAA